jgi:exopolysaccharide biosynthesis polyprenyl glycosylphosphotransferase
MKRNPVDIKRQRKLLKKWFFALALPLLDVLCWVAIYYGISAATGFYNIITPQAVYIPILVLIICMALVGGYRSRSDFASLRYASEHLIAFLFGMPIAGLALYAVASFGPAATSSRGIFVSSVILLAFATLLIRRILWFATKSSRSLGKFLVIFDERLGPVFHRDYSASPQHQGLRYVASQRELRGKPVGGEGSPSAFVEAAHLLPYLDSESAVGYEAIVLAADPDKLPAGILKRLSEINFEHLPVYTMEAFYQGYWDRFPLHLVNDSWPLETEFVLVQHSVYSTIKMVLDFLVALLLLIAASPLLLLSAVAIAVLDGFPIIYSQPRTGLHQRPFTLYKFRTMKVGSDKGDGYTREGDSRVSRLGTFLRKSRLDELPQLWNVLKGDMSMIGPRAEWVRLVADYERQIPHYHYRHLVRPGITGWAQVNYPYGASLDDTLVKLSYDLYYIRNFSLRLDAEVILKTLHVMSFAKGR